MKIFTTNVIYDARFSQATLSLIGRKFVGKKIRHRVIFSLIFADEFANAQLLWREITEGYLEEID